MAYNANQGDIIWLDFTPQAGYEQKLALVVSNNKFNRFEKVTAILCPIMNTDRSIPIHVKLDERTKTSGR